MTGRPARDGDVRGEADRLVRRLELARARLDAALDPREPAPAPGTAPPQPLAPGGRVSTRTGIDDEVRALLAPAVARVARLHEIARSLADGTTSDASAAQAVWALADTQPTRRSR